MYKAVVETTNGFGSEKYRIVADSYKELMTKVEKFEKSVPNWKGLMNTTFKILNIRFSYPSGKYFVKRYV